MAPKGKKLPVDISNDKSDSKEETSDKQTLTTFPYLVHRSKQGLKIISSIQGGSICKDEIFLSLTEDKSNRIEGICCSEDGEILAWCDSKIIKCIKFSTREVVFEQENTGRTNCLYISPKSTKLICYNTMSGGDNLHFWDIPTQSLLASMPFKKASQWKPIFSMNEDLCMQHINNELVLYANNKFDKPKQRISHIKINDFSLSSTSFHSSTYQHLYNKRIKSKAHYIAVYSAGSKGQPSIVKIYKYPNMTDCITNKSFFRADRVKFSWSPSGNSLLLTCMADFDPANKSYYGEQSLNFLNVKGDSYFVKLPKEGTISHIEWYPSCDKDMFVCVYGLQPAQVALFNNKCEVMFKFEEPGAFNAATFSPFGNLLAIYGFGNLSGQLSIWDFEKKKLIAKMMVPDTTYLDWCSDGKHILTCTTAPRLRVNNGFRIWHFSGSLLHEQIASGASQDVEIYDVIWQPKPNHFEIPDCNLKGTQLPNLLSQSELGKFQATAEKYVPPTMRNSSTKVSGFDSATGIGAGGRLIVGLESLNISRDKANNAGRPNPNKSKNKNKNKESNLAKAN